MAVHQAGDRQPQRRLLLRPRTREKRDDDGDDKITPGSLHAGLHWAGGADYMEQEDRNQEILPMSPGLMALLLFSYLGATRDLRHSACPFGTGEASNQERIRRRASRTRKPAYRASSPRAPRGTPGRHRGRAATSSPQRVRIAAVGQQPRGRIRRGDIEAVQRHAQSAAERLDVRLLPRP